MVKRFLPNTHYAKKSTIADSENELIFYKKLMNIISDEDVIIPQVRLSAFLDEKKLNKPAFHRWARRGITGKSVDFLICKKETLKPNFAIEIDGTSHNNSETVIRDIWIEHILKDAGITLIRFRDGEWDTVEQIHDKIIAVVTQKQ
jgi:very-short-patch-repair endonuclease